MALFLSLLKQIAERLSLGSQTESLCERKWMCGRKWISERKWMCGRTWMCECQWMCGRKWMCERKWICELKWMCECQRMCERKEGGSERQWMCEGKWMWVDGYGLMELSQEPFIMEHTARRVHADSFLTITTVPL